MEPVLLIDFYRTWVFFRNKSTKEQILSLEIVIVPVVEKNKINTFLFGGRAWGVG